jgi:hypothetical protein
MGRQTARKGTQHGQLRKGTAGKRCKELEFSKLSERQYWMARSGGLISVALDGQVKRCGGKKQAKGTAGKHLVRSELDVP